MSRIKGADVLLFFLESYGAVVFERPELASRLAPVRAEFESSIRASGHDVVSAFVESPTFGGSSWFAHLTLLSGLEVGDPDTNALLMTEHRETLPTVFARHGYRTIGENAPWDVPVHVITNRRDVLSQLVSRGFQPGVWPKRPSLGKMHTLTPSLLKAFSSK